MVLDGRSFLYLDLLSVACGVELTDGEGEVTGGPP